MAKSRAVTPGGRGRLDLTYREDASKHFLYYYSPNPLLSLRLPGLEKREIIETSKSLTPKLISARNLPKPRSNKEISPAVPPKSRVFRAIWSRIDHEEGRPEVREGAVMAECCGVLYLYGGLSACVLRDLYSKQTVSAAWVPVNTAGLELEARYGHSMLENSTSMVIFGGNTTSSLRTSIRDCLNTVRILEPGVSSRVLTAGFLGTKGTSIDMRRYHSACILGKHMVTIGGMNQKNKVLDDCSVLDLETSKWSSLRLINDAAALACHTAAAVFEPHIRVTGVYDPVLTESSAHLRHRGIYLFGGVNNKGEPNNILRLVQPATKYLICVQLPVTGKRPEPRYQHSMVFSKHTNTLIVFGGKTGTPGQSGNVLNDLHVLDLETLIWAEIVVVGQIPEARCAHAMGTLQDKIVLFGGINLTSFCSAETYWLDLVPHVPSNAQHIFAHPRFTGTRSSSVIRKGLAHKPWMTNN